MLTVKILTGYIVLNIFSLDDYHFLAIFDHNQPKCS